MKPLQEDPTAGWAWDPVRNRFMKPSLLFDGQWEEARPPVWELDDPAYRYDSRRHPLYEPAGRRTGVRENKSAPISPAGGYDAPALVASSVPGEKEANRSGFGVAASRSLPADKTRVAGPEVASLPPDAAPEFDLGAKVKNPTLSGYFDGSRFTIRNDDGRTIRRESYPAVAGRPDSKGNFDYSRERQRIPDIGPIPEGAYWIDPQKIVYSPSRYSLKDWMNILGKITRRGNMLGGTPAWGSGHVAINPPMIDVDGVRRGGFTIHGGDEPGSGGCIDLTKYDRPFFDFLEKYRGEQDSIPIFVEYPQK